MDLDVSPCRRAKAELKPQIALGNIASAAADLVHLPMAAIGYTEHPGANAGAIAFYSDRLHLDPVVLEGALAFQELRIIVDAIDNDVKISVIVEVADRTSAARHHLENAGAGIDRDVREFSRAVIPVKH